MYGSARVLLSLALVILCGNQAFGQVSAQPTPEPIVTAQHEGWYLNGDPVFFAGLIYYPAGPQVYFNRYEMVRSGFFHAIPLYTRTTIEPYSVVFVPIGGGLMQPYERLRAGDVAGTVGSTTPSFPVVIPSEPANQAAMSGMVAQAAAPPTHVGSVDALLPAPPPAARPLVTPPVSVGTSGEAIGPPELRPMRSALRPLGLNGVFVEFERRRYFSSGATVLLGRGRFERIGDYHGFPVYARRGARGTIYIPVKKQAELLAPFSRREPRTREP